MMHARFLSALFLALACLGGFHANAGELAISTHQANLRAGATVAQPVVDVAGAGERVRVLGYRDGYALVRRDSGRQGWVHAAGQGWTEAQVRAAMAEKAVRPASPAVEAVPAALPETAAPPSPLSLAALGQKQGHYFEGARSIHSQVFYFPLPLDRGVRGGTLRLRYRASGGINPVSNLRVDINDQPVRSVSLGEREAPAWLDVPVSAADLARSALKVTVRASLVATPDRCFDERSLALFFVQIMPETRLDLDLAPDEGSLRAAWSRLPTRVRLALPGQESESRYATTLETAMLLQQARRQVEVVASAEEADIVIAPEAELARLAGRQDPSLVAGESRLGAMGTWRRADGRTVIGLAEGLDTRLLSRQAPAWLGLFTADSYRAATGGGGAEAPEALDLLKLGLEATQHVNRTVEWSMLLTPPVAPGGKWLDSLRLNVVAPPQEAVGKLLLYVYLNGALQEVRQLDQDGKPHVQSFDLRRASQRVGANHLRIVVQRVADDGDCTGDVATFPIQFLPGSVLSLENWNETPVRFDDLRALFSQAPELWVAPGGGERLARELPLVAGLFVNHGFPFDRGRLHFLAAGAKPAPKGPFILLGRAQQAPDKVAVHLDRGRMRVVDGQGRNLLEVDRLPAITVAQLVQQGGQHGLWLAPALEGELPPPAELHLNQDDVAFADEGGVVLTLASRQHALAHAEYPDYLDWLDWLAQHRFWIIGLGWTLLAVFLLHLWRISRKHAGR